MNDYFAGPLSADQMQEIANKIVAFMDETGLNCDMEPEQNEYDKRWYLPFCDERGNTYDDASFDTEEEGSRVSEIVWEVIESRP